MRHRAPRARVAALVAVLAVGCGAARPELGAMRAETSAPPPPPARMSLPDNPTVAHVDVPRLAADPCRAITDALRQSAGVAGEAMRTGTDGCRAGDESYVEVRVAPVRSSAQDEIEAFQLERPGEQWPLEGVPGLPLTHVAGGRLEVVCFFEVGVVTFTLPDTVVTTMPDDFTAVAVEPAVVAALAAALSNG